MPRGVRGFADELQRWVIALQERWEWQEIMVNRPAERELRVELRDAKDAGLRIRAVQDTAWLSTTEDFEGVFGKPEAGGEERNTRW